MRKRKETIENLEEYIDDDYEEEVVEEIIEEEFEEENNHKSRRRTKRIINILFIVIMLILTMIAVDVISVARYDNGPYFAIKTKTYKDGGTKVYYGAGYKVIKYHQVQGRRDKVVGTWNLKYTSEPTDISALDLAIEFNNNPESTYKKYYKQFVRVNGTYIKSNEKNNKFTFGYKDPDNKYTLNIVCSMADGATIPEKEKNDEITTIGTIRKFEYKTNKKLNTLYIDDCFAE